VKRNILMTNQDKTEMLRNAMMEAGACLVGFADLSCLDINITKGYSFGVSFVLQYDIGAVDSLPNTEPFLTMKAEIEERARKLYDIAVSLIESWGYHHTRISSGIPASKLPDMREELPQKTVATLAGLGWIGKSTLLVSSDYGPRLRLGAILTDLPFRVDTPVVHSDCDDCNRCADACPVGAIKGANWSQGVDRADLLDVRLCYEYYSQKNLCGLCLKACHIGRQ
jgi:epoxyqueuosine reductase